MRTHKLTRTIAAAAIAAAAFGGGYLTAIQLHGQAVSPQPCYVMDGPAGPETGTASQNTSWLPSGDAARMAGGLEFVCTDGTWVHVTHYGNGS